MAEDQGEAVAAHHYSIVGQNADRGGVKHVGLLVEPAPGGTVRKGSEVLVFHMGPPLYVGERETAADRPPLHEAGQEGTAGRARPVMIAHAVACMYEVVGSDVRYGLTRDELQGIQTWIERLRTAPSLYGYLPHPAWVEARDPANRKPRGIRFSCSGFVSRAYFEAGIALIEGLWSEVDDPSSPEVEVRFSDAVLPEVDPEVIDRIWGDLLGRRSRAAVWSGTPLRVLLPGYLLHALKRPRGARPYTPQKEHWQF